jgi:cytochrome P450
VDRACGGAHNGVVTSIEQALTAWGGYDRDDPFALFAEVQARGPVHAVTLVDGHAAWLVVGYEEARAALNDPRLSKDMRAALAAAGDVVAEGLPGPEFARHMLNVDPPDHTRLRRLVAGAFTMHRIEALRPRVHTLIDDLLDAMALQPEDRPIDLVKSFAFPLPFTVICDLLGVPDQTCAPFGEALVALLSPYSTDDEFARAKTGSDAVVQFLGELVATKQHSPGDDLVSALLAARDGTEQLSQPELLSTIFQLVVAGHDTTASLIGNGLVALLSHPDQLARLRAEPDRFPAAIEEILRYDAPVPHATFRYTIDPVPIGDVTIPAGAQVIICLAAANRDPSRYAHPEELDIDRPYVPHVAFGHGIHFCLGAALARMEGQLALASLLERFPQLRLAGTRADLHWGHGDGLVLRGLSELPVIPGPARTPPTLTERTRPMSRKTVDCRDFPSETGCTLTISGTEMEVIQAAAEHAVSTHGHADGPELRHQIQGMLKDETPAAV